MKGSGIYVIVGKRDKRTYIGSTSNFEKRWGHHRWKLNSDRHANPHLQAAWNKYGEESFEFGVLEYLEDLEELYLAEQFWMDVYREEGKSLYNIGRCADSPRRGVSLSEEHKERIGQANKNRCLPPISEKTRDKMRKRSPSEETRAKMSQAAMGHKVTLETRGKLRLANLGKKHTEASRAKMRKSQRDTSPEIKARRNQAVRLANARPYPEFVHSGTGEILPAGINLTALCKKLNLSPCCMRNVVQGRQKRHRGWRLGGIK